METQESVLYGTNAKETGNLKSSEIDRIMNRAEGTPFMVSWEKDKGWSYGLANYRVSEFKETEEEVLEEIKRMDWTSIIAVVGVMIDATLKLEGIKK